MREILFGCGESPIYTEFSWVIPLTVIVPRGDLIQVLLELQSPVVEAVTASGMTV